MRDCNGGRHVRPGVSASAARSPMWRWWRKPAAITWLPTIPRDFRREVIDGIRPGLSENAIDPADVACDDGGDQRAAAARRHQSEYDGARCGFIATRGFRDLFALRQASPPDLSDTSRESLFARRRPPTQRAYRSALTLAGMICSRTAPLVPRRYRWEITERVVAQGDIAKQFNQQGKLGTVCLNRLYTGGKMICHSCIGRRKMHDVSELRPS
jgi:hypothetical protein